MNTALFTFRNSEGFEPLGEIPDVSFKKTSLFGVAVF